MQILVNTIGVSKLRDERNMWRIVMLKDLVKRGVDGAFFLCLWEGTISQLLVRVEVSSKGTGVFACNNSTYPSSWQSLENTITRR